MCLKANESMCAKLLPSCLTLCDPIDCSLPGSSVHGILRARILEWVAVSYSRGIFPIQGIPTQGSHVFCIGRRVFFTTGATWEAQQVSNYTQKVREGSPRAPKFLRTPRKMAIRQEVAARKTQKPHVSHWPRAERGKPDWSAVELRGRLQQKRLDFPSTCPGRGEQGVWWVGGESQDRQCRGANV